MSNDFTLDYSKGSMTMQVLGLYNLQIIKIHLMNLFIDYLYIYITLNTFRILKKTTSTTSLVYVFKKDTWF